MTTTSKSNYFGIGAMYSWGMVATLLVAFIALFFSLQAGIFALFFLAAAWWIWQNPEEGFLFFIVIAPLLPMLKITQTIGTVSLIKDVIIITLFLKVFALPLLQKKLSYRRNILVAPVLVLVVWGVLAALRADSLILGILRLRDIGLYILLFFAVLYLEHDKKTMKRRLKWFTLSFTVVLALGMWQWFFSVDSAVLRLDPARNIWIPRLSSILAHPSIFGQYLVAAASLFLPLAFFATQKKLRVLYTAIFVATLPFIFLTYSRAVWIGMIASLGAIALVFAARQVANKVSKKKLSQYAGGLAVGAAIALILLTKFTSAGPFIRSIVDPTYGSNEERLTFFVRLVAPTTNKQAIIGRGLGDVTAQNFRQVDLEAYDIAAGASRAVQLAKNRTLVDNQYLKTFVEMGVIGLVLFGWIYWRLILNTAKKTIYSKKPIIPLWQIGFLAAFIIQAFFIDIWDIFPTNAMFWIVAALTSQGIQK